MDTDRKTGNILPLITKIKQLVSFNQDDSRLSMYA